MKIALIADTHHGERADNIHILNYQKKFLDNVFFRYCEINNIRTLCHLGDVAHNRRTLNLNTFERLKTDFLNPVSDQFEEVFWNIGNHDAYFKTNLSVNVQELLEVKGHVVKKPQFIFEGRNLFSNFVMIPWICQDNREEIFSFLRENKAKYCLGHFELAGFPQQDRSYLSRGDDSSILRNFDFVYSGHFHTRSKLNNINYIGSAFHFNWGDIKSPWRGFCVLDTDTSKMTYIRNPYHLFTTISYNEEHLPQDLSQFKNTYCRIFVMNKTSDLKFNDFVKQIKDQGVIDLVIIEDFVKIEGESPKLISLENRDKIFIDHIKELDYSDQDGLLLLFNDIYERAKNVAQL